MKENNVR